MSLSTDGCDYSHGEEKALSEIPVRSIQVSFSWTNSSVHDVIKKLLKVSRAHWGVLRQKLALAQINVSLQIRVMLQILRIIGKLSANLEISFQVLFKAREENTTS